MALARELIALENVRDHRLELAGDAVARREVTARLAALQGQIEGEIQRAFDTAKWFRKHYSPKMYRQAGHNTPGLGTGGSQIRQMPQVAKRTS